MTQEMYDTSSIRSGQKSDMLTPMNELSPDETFSSVSIVSPEELEAIWHRLKNKFEGTCHFVLPPWLTAWWSIFGEEAQPLIAVVKEGEAVVGIAPFMVQDHAVRFLGDPEICDYFDCMVARDREDGFFQTLFDELAAQGFKDFELGPVLPDSALRRFFSRGRLPSDMDCCIGSGGVLLELDLPGSWDELLNALSGKERHELRRKLRRLYKSGSVDFRRVDHAVQLPEALETFLRLFTMNRRDKTEFMTGRMASFFRSLAFSLASHDMLRLYLLYVDEQPVASVFCFDHLGKRYLYNNGYDDSYRDLSVGLMSKALSIQAAIEDGLSTYSFLKGSELYKHRLGGREIPLKKYFLALS
jgi:CelD/BcsL family acetyltransferase involved in cellulose biosynthesis